VFSSTLTGSRVKETVHRTIRWLDRCLLAHERPDEQSIFPIVQDSLNPELRSEYARQLIKWEEVCAVRGFFYFNGGESKDYFWRMVHFSTNILPKNKPRYLMGVGFAIDLIACSALGIDMYDCVFPTRTFGYAVMKTGQLNLKTCKTYSRTYLHQIATVETVSCHLLTVHNIAFQIKLMIKEQRFPRFIQDYMLIIYPNEDYPTWIINALQAVNVTLL
ncbi:putative queuine tRNA-ribosyltransferase, partial [Trachymyrmex cornetzi]